MAICSGMHQIVRFKNGNVWHFYHKKERGIFFRILGSKGLWENPIELLIGVTEDFSLNIDDLDNLHLICRAKTGEILYMKYDGKLWSRQVLSRFEPLRYIIKYPTIITIGSHIHIIFALGTTFNTGYWSLYHYYWNEKEWHSTEITKFTAGQHLRIFNVEMTESHIHLVYRGLLSHRYQIFHCRYNIEHGIWSIPENVTHSTEDCNMPSMIIADNQLHLAWVTLVKSSLSIKYRNKPINNGNGWSDEITISDTGVNSTLPYLLYLEGKLWCIWSQNDNLYASCSTDNGATWNLGQPLDFEKNSNYYLAYYRTNYPGDIKLFKINRTYCTIDKGLKIPILENLLGLPEYNSALTPSPWDFTKQFEFPAEPGVEQDNKKMQPEPDSGAVSKSKIPSQARQAYSLQTFEQVVLKEMERFEEHSYSILSKLEDSYKSHENSIAEVQRLLCENTEMLHSIKTEIEHLKTELKNSKGFLKRIFS